MFFTSKYFPRLVECFYDIVADFPSFEILADSSDVGCLSEEVGCGRSSIDTV